MAEELIRKVSLLGNNKVIIGNGQTDIVLDTLGKIYIKTGNNLKLLTEIITQLSKISKQETKELLNKVLIVNNVSEMVYPGDGILIFDLSKNSLYLSYDERYILILQNVDQGHTHNEPDLGYVKKAGDSMSGTLSLLNDNPLIIASKQLILNLNSLFLNGHESKEFTQKAIDEYIIGHWTFHDVDIDHDLKVLHNAIIKNFIGTEYCDMGYGGSGWRIDSNTNTMIIDNLIVRKAMQVYELIINQIRATNGTLWVTDTCKIKGIVDWQLLDLNNMPEFLSEKIWYLPYGDNINVHEISITGDHLANLNGVGKDTSFINVDFIFLLRTSTPSSTIKEILLGSSPISDNINIVYLFNNHRTDTQNFQNQNNQIYNIKTTPRYFSTKNLKSIPKAGIQEIYSYYKYFGLDSLNNSIKYLKIIETDKDHYPPLKEGDIIRCQKFKDNNIKYYDALVVSSFNIYNYILLTAPSVWDRYGSEDKINIGYYSKSNQLNIVDATQKENIDYLERNPQEILATIDINDEVVRIGSLTDLSRQGSLYLSSTDVNNPVLKVINGVNKPDFEVRYLEPKFLTRLDTSIKLQRYYQISDIPLEGFTLESGKYYKYFDTPNLDCAMDIQDNLVKGYFNSPIKTLLGNLLGIENPLFGEDLPKGYGLYGSNVYLTGEFYLNNGVSLAKIGDGITLEVQNNLGKAGLKIKYENDQSKIEMQANLIEIRNGDEVAALFRNGLIDAKWINVDTMSFNLLLGKNELHQNILGINTLSKGESILFYSKGSIMNGKFTIYDKSNNVIGCREYFLMDTSSEPLPLNLTILKDQSDPATYIETNYSEFIIKIIDYFEPLTPLNFTEGSFLTVNWESLKSDLNSTKLQSILGETVTTIDDFFKKCVDIIKLVETVYNTNPNAGNIISDIENKYITIFTTVVNHIQPNALPYYNCTSVNNVDANIYISPIQYFNVSYFWYKKDIYDKIYDKLGKSNFSITNQALMSANTYGDILGFCDINKRSALSKNNYDTGLTIHPTLGSDLLNSNATLCADLWLPAKFPNLSKSKIPINVVQSQHITIRLKNGRYFNLPKN